MKTKSKSKVFIIILIVIGVVFVYIYYKKNNPKQLTLQDKIIESNNSADAYASRRYMTSESNSGGTTSSGSSSSGTTSPRSSSSGTTSSAPTIHTKPQPPVVDKSILM